MNLILASIGVFLGIILLLVVILLVAKQYLTPSGKVKITINGEKELEVEQGSTLLNTLSVNGIYLSSAFCATAKDFSKSWHRLVVVKVLAVNVNARL